MAIKGYTIFSNAPRLGPHHQVKFNVIPRTLVGGWSDSSVEMQLAYFTNPEDWSYICR